MAKTTRIEEREEAEAWLRRPPRAVVPHPASPSATSPARTGEESTTANLRRDARGPGGAIAISAPYPIPQQRAGGERGEAEKEPAPAVGREEDHCPLTDERADD